MLFLEIRSEVKITVTKEWYVILWHHKTHPHTKVWIPTSNNMRYAQDTIILESRSEVKVTVTIKKYTTQPSQDAATHQIWTSYLKE